MSDDKMPDVIYKAENSCTLCHGYGLYVVGSSGSSDDGDAPMYEGCDCVVKYISESHVQRLIAQAKAEQREACKNAYVDWITGEAKEPDYTPEQAIMNATEDK